eukprot:2417324-Amphidinium_carterae.1
MKRIIEESASESLKSLQSAIAFGWRYCITKTNSKHEKTQSLARPKKEKKGLTVLQSNLHRSLRREKGQTLEVCRV